jgi:hypothetical protein
MLHLNLERTTVLYPIANLPSITVLHNAPLSMSLTPSSAAGPQSFEFQTEAIPGRLDEFGWAAFVL